MKTRLILIAAIAAFAPFAATGAMVDSKAAQAAACAKAKADENTAAADMAKARTDAAAAQAEKAAALAEATAGAFASPERAATRPMAAHVTANNASPPAASHGRRRARGGFSGSKTGRA